MKIDIHRYDELIAQEERLNVLQDIIDRHEADDEPDMELICCILGLNANKVRERKQRKHEELLAWVAKNEKRKETEGNGNTV